MSKSGGQVTTPTYLLKLVGEA